MKKRVIAAAVAGLLAVLGVAVIIIWAQGADTRAYKGAKLTEVVRLTADVPAGTTSDKLSQHVEVDKTPASAVPAGALTSLTQLQGLVSVVPLVKGEILVRSRLSTPGVVQKDLRGVPKGLQELSVSLGADKVLGGKLKAGDHVGIIASFATPDQTAVIRNEVLVVDIAGVDLTGKGPGNAIITLAVSTSDAEKIVHASTFGTLWLTRQNDQTETSDAAVIGRKDVLK